MVRTGPKQSSKSFQEHHVPRKQSPNEQLQHTAETESEDLTKHVASIEEKIPALDSDSFDKSVLQLFDSSVCNSLDQKSTVIDDQKADFNDAQSVVQAGIDCPAPWASEETRNSIKDSTLEVVGNGSKEVTLEHQSHHEMSQEPELQSVNHVPAEANNRRLEDSDAITEQLPLSAEEEAAPATEASGIEACGIESGQSATDGTATVTEAIEATSEEDEVASQATVPSQEEFAALPDADTSQLDTGNLSLENHFPELIDTKISSPNNFSPPPELEEQTETLEKDETRFTMDLSSDEYPSPSPSSLPLFFRYNLQTRGLCCCQ